MYRSLILVAGISCCLITSVRGADLLPPLTTSPSGFQFSVTGSTNQSTVVEASTDLQNWTVLQTNAPGPTNVTVTDTQSPNYTRRYYRTRLLPLPLPNLSLLTNSVFMSGEGFNTLQFAPNGKLGFVAWQGQDLIYRERVNGSWSEHVLVHTGSTYAPGAFEEYRFQPQVALFFDSQSRAHIVRLLTSSVIHHVQLPGGGFSGNSISLSGVGSSFSLFSAAMGPGDSLHLALIGSGYSPPLKYGTDKTGSWQWTTVTTITGYARGFLQQSYAPRWFSMAIDTQNYAHLTFCPEFVMGQSPEGYLRPYSELHYASNRGGTWSTVKIADVADGSGDAGNGASIAMAPDNQPAIAAWYNERASTGSSQFCQLNYFKRASNGAWTKQLVTGTSAGYTAGDGERGAGFAPYLRFDGQGRPNIAFCDDASEHFATTGQNEYAGDLRHAWFDGTRWSFRTILAQANALNRQIVYPAMAIFGDEVVFTGLDRRTVWQAPDYREATSKYSWFYFEKALP